MKEQVVAQRVGDWLQTYKGNRIYPLDPRAEEIDIEDIAHALSNLCRYGGHSQHFYSVAEHSCCVSDLLPKELKLAGLLHDASEAYLCDLPRPLKRSPGFSEQYLIAERELMRVIAVRFDFEWPLHQLVHDADDQMLATEALQLMSPIHPDWILRCKPVEGLYIECWEPHKAEEQFLDRFFMLTDSGSSESENGESE